MNPPMKIFCVRHWLESSDVALGHRLGWHGLVAITEDCILFSYSYPLKGSPQKP